MKTELTRAEWLIITANAEGSAHPPPELLTPDAWIKLSSSNYSAFTKEYLRKVAAMPQTR